MKEYIEKYLFYFAFIILCCITSCSKSINQANVLGGNSRYNMTVNDIRIKLYPRYLKSKDELTIESEDLKDLNMHVASSQSLGLKKC